ncbi:MAG: hypothetical protein HQL43_14730 [Alphaproteobacteria bacterium]|nr:hypothetical protein [Alphaproteobacteria bacterium]
MRRASRLLVALYVTAASCPVLATEVRLECPKASPTDSFIPFYFGKPYPYGYPEPLEESRKTSKGGVTYLEFDFTDFNSNKAVLMCEFKDRSSIELPIPGLLLRCGMTLRNYDSRKKPTEWLDVWCISDDAQEPAPEIK